MVAVFWRLCRFFETDINRLKRLPGVSIQGYNGFLPALTKTCLMWINESPPVIRYSQVKKKPFPGMVPAHTAYLIASSYVLSGPLVFILFSRS